MRRPDHFFISLRLILVFLGIGASYLAFSNHRRHHSPGLDLVENFPATQVDASHSATDALTEDKKPYTHATSETSSSAISDSKSNSNELESLFVTISRRSSRNQTSKSSTLENSTGFLHIHNLTHNNLLSSRHLDVSNTNIPPLTNPNLTKSEKATPNDLYKPKQNDLSLVIPKLTKKPNSNSDNLISASSKFLGRANLSLRDSKSISSNDSPLDGSLRPTNINSTTSGVRNVTNNGKSNSSPGLTSKHNATNRDTAHACPLLSFGNTSSLYEPLAPREQNETSKNPRADPRDSNSSKPRPGSKPPRPTFDPLTSNLTCNQYPEWDFNASSEPKAKPVIDPISIMPIPLDQVPGLANLNNTVCKFTPAESFLVGPDNPYLYSYGARSAYSNYSALIRAGIVWDTSRDECKTFSDTTINGGVSFSGSGERNLDCETIMTNITNTCNSPHGEGKQGGTMYYKCAVWYWQPTSDHQSSQSKRQDGDDHNNGSDDSASWHPPSDTDQSLGTSYSTDDSSSFDDTTTIISNAKGRQLWNELQISLYVAHDSPCANLQGWDISPPRVFPFLNVYNAECRPRGVLAELDGNPEPPRTERVCSNSYTLLQITSHEGLPANTQSNFDYTNWYSPTAGSIVAMHNYGRINPRLWESDSPTGERTEQLSTKNWPTANLRWADAVFTLWSSVCRYANRDTSVLKFVTRTNITNSATQIVMARILEEGMPSSSGTTSSTLTTDRLSLYPGQDDFFSLLGTPNGVGVAQLLTKHVDSFASRDEHGQYKSVKTIEKILLYVEWQSNQWHLGFVLVDVPPPPGFIGDT